MEIIEKTKESRRTNEFELCYMRHRYLKRITDNPTQEEMEPYRSIILNLSRHTYLTYKNLFDIIGFILEDLVNIAYIHLVNFLGLFSLEKTEQKYEEFIEKHIQKKGFPPDKKDISQKNKANFTLFLKQRMEDVVRVCRNKARNIKGLPSEEFYVYCGESDPPEDERELLRNHKKYKYRKVDINVFRSIKRKAKQKNNLPFKFNGLWYICVKLEQKILTLSDFKDVGLDPYDNMHNKNPEEIYLLRQREIQFEENKENFYGHSDQYQVKIIKSFIEKNENNSFYREEIDLAKKYVDKLERRICGYFR